MKDLRHIIKHVKTDVLSAPKGSSKKEKQVELYRFDFSSTKLVLEDYFVIMNLMHKNGIKLERLDRGCPYSYSLPPEFEDMVEYALFAIPSKAMDTINYLLLNATMHWNNPIYKGYDTCVRETLLNISQEFVHKAIYLIFDYLYDPNTKYHWRQENNEISKQVLRDMTTYTFWRNRTGRGNQISFAGFEHRGKTEYEYGGKYFYVAQEIKAYEKHQENVINACEHALNVNKIDVEDYSSLKEDDTQVKINKLKVYRVNANKEVSKVNEIVLKTTDNSKPEKKEVVIDCSKIIDYSIDVAAESKEEVIRIVKNHFYKIDSDFENFIDNSEYIKYNISINELLINNIAPTEKGIISIII